MSAHREMQVRARRHGIVKHFLQKPFDMECLLCVVDRYLAGTVSSRGHVQAGQSG